MGGRSMNDCMVDCMVVGMVDGKIDGKIDTARHSTLRQATSLGGDFS
jgi:hypothetical protein